MTKTSDSMGVACGRLVAMKGRPSFAGASQAAYLCDAGCRPNPGTHLPVVWDGSRFLTAEEVDGTNHRAAYHAVQVALRDAAACGARGVEIRLTSDLVYRQLSTGGYCRSADLADLRDLTLTLADAVVPIRLLLVKQPFTLGGMVFRTRRQLRDHVLARDAG